MLPVRIKSAALALGLSVLSWVVPAAAQEYPGKTVTIVVPLAPGTGMDLVARIYAEDLAKALGKPVVIENQPGAALMLATQNVAKATPDGHTLLVSTTLPMTAAHLLAKKVNYDPDRDFVPLSLYLSAPFVVIVSPGLGVNSLQAFAAHAKARSTDPLTYASSGTGGLTHLTMEFIRRDLDFAANHVPYRNSGQIVTDVVGGHVGAAISETGIALGLIKDGKLKALAITSSTRHPQLPDVPTVAEAGGKPGFEAVAWHVLVAPSATPKPIVDRLVVEMRRITAEPAFQQRLSTIGVVPRAPIGADAMKSFIQAERVRWSGAIKTLGLEGSQ